MYFEWGGAGAEVLQATVMGMICRFESLLERRRVAQRHSAKAEKIAARTLQVRCEEISVRAGARVDGEEADRGSYAIMYFIQLESASACPNQECQASNTEIFPSAREAHFWHAGGAKGSLFHQLRFESTTDRPSAKHRFHLEHTLPHTRHTLPRYSSHSIPLWSLVHRAVINRKASGLPGYRAGC